MYLMIELYCSVCGRNNNLSMVQGTIICLACLDKIKKETQNKGSGLSEEVAVAIKENDIYD